MVVLIVRLMTSGFICSATDCEWKNVLSNLTELMGSAASSHSNFSFISSFSVLRAANKYVDDCTFLVT